MRIKKKKKSRFSDVWFRLKKSKTAMLGLTIFALIILMVIFADVIANYQDRAITMNITNKFQPPGKDHWFGTDSYGRDLFARVVHGSRISLVIGVAATVGSVFISGILGSVC